MVVEIITCVVSLHYCHLFFGLYVLQVKNSYDFTEIQIQILKQRVWHSDLVIVNISLTFISVINAVLTNVCLEFHSSSMLTDEKIQLMLIMLCVPSLLHILRCRTSCRYCYIDRSMGLIKCPIIKQS